VTVGHYIGNNDQQRNAVIDIVVVASVPTQPLGPARLRRAQT
jgi:hypothetical protein